MEVNPRLRVISMVPSWTETLINAGIEVVGRTRFCIHPKDRVALIPAIGGTKDWNLQRVRELSADLILLDQEENPKTMAEEAPVPWCATHIQRIEDVPQNLRKINQALRVQALEDLALRWEQAVLTPIRPGLRIEALPGIRKWIRQPEPGAPISQVLYLIWREPLMAVSQDTFIGSVFQKVSGGLTLPSFPTKYPELKLSHYDSKSTLLLFSSEPFPFERYEEDLRRLKFPCAFVDGELFSWFGSRSLRFIEELRQ